jgi:hypothetical protein
MLDKDVTGKKDLLAWNPTSQKHTLSEGFFKDNLPISQKAKISFRGIPGWMNNNPSASISIGNDIDVGADLPTSEQSTAELESIVISLIQELASGIEKVKNLCDACKGKSIIKQSQLFDIDENYEVLNPIPIIIEEYSDETIVSFTEVELFGTGKTESEAILNLKLNIIDLYTDLTSTKNENLGKLPLSWLRILKKVIKPIGKSK